MTDNAVDPCSTLVQVRIQLAHFLADDWLIDCNNSYLLFIYSYEKQLFYIISYRWMVVGGNAHTSVMLVDDLFLHLQLYHCSLEAGFLSSLFLRICSLSMQKFKKKIQSYGKVHQRTVTHNHKDNNMVTSFPRKRGESQGIMPSATCTCTH